MLRKENLGSIAYGAQVRTGIVMEASSVGALADSRSVPIVGQKISPRGLGAVLERALPMRVDPEMRTSRGGTRNEVVYRAGVSINGGARVLASRRSLTQEKSHNPRETELHASDRSPSFFDAYWVPPDQRALFTYPDAFESTFDGKRSFSYGNLTQKELSGAVVLVPGGFPHDLAPAEGRNLEFAHVTNDVLSANRDPRIVRHVDVLNLPKSDEPSPKILWALGHDLGVGGKEINTGVQGNETMIYRRPNPEVVVFEVIDDRLDADSLLTEGGRDYLVDAI